MTWTVRGLVGEALRNRTPLRVLHASVSTLLLTGLGLSTALVATDALRQDTARRAAGAEVWIARPILTDALPAAQCDALSNSRGVHAAGGIIVEHENDFHLFDGAPAIPTVLVSPHTLEVWGTRAHSGLHLGNELAELGHIRTGSSLSAGGAHTVVVRSRLDSKIPVAALRSSLVLVTPPLGEVNECWLRMDHGAHSWGPQVLESGFPGVGVRVAPFSSPPAGVLSAAERWRAHTDLRTWALVGTVVALVAAVLTWSRRHEFGVYRLFGARRSDVALLSAAEHLVILVLATSLSLSLSFIATAALHGSLSPQLTGIVLRSIVAAALTGWAGGTVMSMLTSGGNVSAQLKDR